MQILEAFRALNALNEDVFSLDADGIKGLSDFKNNDDFEDDISIIDPEAETKEDLQDNYIGKVILDCCVCHSKLYKSKDEVTIDENGELANVGEECPYCFTPDGFKVIGEVAAFENKSEEKDEEKDNEDEKKEEQEDAEETDEKDESLKEGIFGIKTKKEKEAEAKAKADREAKRKADQEARKQRERDSQQFAVDSWKRYDAAAKQAERDYNRTRFDSIKGVKPSNTGYRGVNYSGGDYYESLEDDRLEESIEDLSMTANDTHVEIGEDANGKVTVTMEPATADGGEMIAPVSDETEAELLGAEEEAPVDGEETTEEAPAEDEVDIEVDEVDEESMDELGESYFKRVYENVNGFKTTAVRQQSNSLVVEGKIKFDNGKVRKTSFMFEALDATKAGKVRFVGDNKNLTEGKKAFMLTGKMEGNKLIAESLNYNYKHEDAEGKVSRVYGTERTSRR